MANILIVDDDLESQKILEMSLQKYTDDFQILFANNGEEAIMILEQHTIDLLVTEIQLPKMDGFALLSYLSSNYPAIPCIVLTSYIIPGLKKNLSKKVFKFLNKPVDTSVLAALIKEGLGGATRSGDLDAVSIPGLLQIIEAEKKTCLLVIRANGKDQGGMYIHEGVLYDAICGKLKGADAAIQLITLDKAQIDYRQRPRKTINRKITTGIQALILEAMRVKDEAEVESEDPQQVSMQRQAELLKEGIQLCEGLHFKKAQKILLTVTSHDPDNLEAWLWLSRTVSSMKLLRVALTKAYKQDPKHLDVMHDIRMSIDASKMNLERIRRCQFCYAPLDVKVVDCHHCGVDLRITKDILSKIGDRVNHSEVQTALERFERVLAREVNLPVLFYAGLSCLHLNNLDASLEYLEQLQKFDHEENIYSSKVERIVAFIASKQIRDEAIISQIQVPDPPALKDVPDRKKVLVVEDSRTTRKVIKMTLESNNFDVVEAEDGVEALSRLNDDPPDLILLDVMLPKLDGYGILTVLKQNDKFKDIPVIMLTSKDGLKDKLKGRFSSASAYLTKPFKPDMLIKKVDQYIY